MPPSLQQPTPVQHPLLAAVLQSIPTPVWMLPGPPGMAHSPALQGILPQRAAW